MLLLLLVVKQALPDLFSECINDGLGNAFMHTSGRISFFHLNSRDPVPRSLGTRRGSWGANVDARKVLSFSLFGDVLTIERAAPGLNESLLNISCHVTYPLLLFLFFCLRIILTFFSDPYNRCWRIERNTSRECWSVVCRRNNYTETATRKIINLIEN